MFAHLIHLLLRSLSDIPTALGSTTFGILFPVLVAVLGEALGVWRFGWRDMVKSWKKAIGAGAIALAIGYTVLLSVLVIKNIYADHMELVNKLAARKQLANGLDASMGMIIEGAGANGGLMIFASINIANGVGPERPLRDWKLEIVVDGKKTEPVLIPFSGDQMSIPVPEKHKAMIFNQKDYCPVVTENPLPSGASRTCWMMRYFDVDVKNVARKDIGAIVSFKDLTSGKVHEMKTDIGPNENDFPWTIPKR
jgi:hypothetical protein